MKLSGQFIHCLDLCDLGMHGAVVSWEGYRAPVPTTTEGDFDSMKITVSADLGGRIIDVTGLLLEDVANDIKEKAWAMFPPRAVVAANLAAIQYQEFRDQRAELES